MGTGARPRAARLAAAVLALAAMTAAIGPAPTWADSRGLSRNAAADVDAAVLPARAWAWPVAAPFRLDAPYVQPAQPYGPGHRGIDLLPLGDAEVRAPDAGVIAFSGMVAGRPVITIDHGGGLVSTLEPAATTLVTGDEVRRGAVVGELALGGHAQSGRLHLGARLHGEYINPMLLLGGVPRAVLLPCCP